MFPQAVLDLEAFKKVTLIAPRVASEASKVLMVRNWTSVWDAIRSTPGASPPHFNGRGKYGKLSYLNSVMLTTKMPLKYFIPTTPLPFTRPLSWAGCNKNGFLRRFPRKET